MNLTFVIDVKHAEQWRNGILTRIRRNIITMRVEKMLVIFPPVQY